MRRALAKIKKSERGTVMLLTAVVLVAMLGMLALSIDLGFLYSMRTQLQSGLDAAALAGAINLRATIEASPDAAPERDRLAKAAATDFAFNNKVRRYKEREKDGEVDPDDPVNKIKLGENDVSVKNLSDAKGVSVVPDTQLVEVHHTVEVPMFFSGLFGLYEAKVGGTALASVAPVDGGTGGIGGGVGTYSCWRPLLLPDTFFDANNKVWAVGERAGGDKFELPMQAGDYYRSRFALGARNTLPFVDTPTGDGGWATGIRDTQFINEVGAKTHLGTLLLRIPQKYYLIPDFPSNLRTTKADLPLSLQAESYGFCGKLRVGMEIPIFERLPGSKPYTDVQEGLRRLKLANLEEPNEDAWAQYRYVTTRNYAGANTHPAILPVLLFDPLILKKNADGSDPPMPGGFKVKVTNIGLFYLAQIDANGDLIGTFVREVFAEGTPIDKENMPLGAADTPPSFKRSWLPVAPRLIK